jgi:LPXTG-site transpeptidase (sortase) family protein
LTQRPGWWSRRAGAAACVVALTLGLAACGGTDPAFVGQPSAGASDPAPTDSPATVPADGEAPPAAVGTPAASNRVTFVPDRVVLPGGDAAPVQPAVTRDGELQVPEDVQHVGWWDGSAHAGDPFGNTVVAGHVDSATDGLGFFVRLLALKKGETVTLRGPDGHHLAYTITSIRTIKKHALATGSAAFDQGGDPHLVLITCGGEYHRGEGGYDSNVVVTAKPKGLAR